MKPQFEHDCDECVLLGRIEHSRKTVPDFMPDDDGLLTLAIGLCDVKHVDLYWCEKQPRPTVIARYSDEGSDYVSGLMHAGANKDLLAAKKLAMRKGLLK